jgi:hypothetical protein
MKKTTIFSVALVAVLTTNMVLLPVALADDAYTLMNQAQWGDESATATATGKPLRSMVEDAKADYVQNTPDLYTKGHHRQTMQEQEDTPMGVAPVPAMGRSSHKKIHTVTNTSDVWVTPKNVHRLKPVAGYIPSKRPITPEHSPWKEMRSFSETGNALFF